MIDTLENDSTLNNNFIFIVILFFALQIVQRIFVSPTLSVDEAEQLILSQFFSFGYNEQPPLYTWLQIGSIQLFGSTVLSLSLLKNSLLCVTFIYYYRLAKLVSKSEVKAIAATLGLYLIPQVFWEAKVDQTHSVIVTMASVLSLYNFVQIFRGYTSITRFLLLGLVCGVGVLSKYNFVLLLFAATFPLLFIAEFRKMLFVKKLFFSFLSFSAVVFPHAVWFLGHVTDATKSTVERMHHQSVLESSSGMIGGVFDLFVSTITFTGLLLVFWVIFFRKGYHQIIDSEFKKYFSIFFVTIYLMLLVLIICLDISSIKERWLLPYLVFFPLYLTLCTTKEILRDKIGVMTALCVSIAVLSGVAYVVGPRLVDATQHASRIQTPFAKLKPQIEQVFHSLEGAQVYAVNYFIGGNIRHLFPEKFVITKEKELQPDEHTKLLFFYDKKEPHSLLKTLKSMNFECTADEMRASYLYSNELQYTLKYQSCRKTS